MVNLAHDLRNLLAVILGYCDLALGGKSPAAESVQYIQKAASRCLELLNAEIFWHGEPIKLKAIGTEIYLNEIAEEIFATLQSLKDPILTIKLDLGEAIPFPCEGDSWQLYRAIFNLCMNARAAIAFEKPVSGGLLTIITRAEPDKIWLAVQDNGCGLTVSELAEVMYNAPLPNAQHGRGISIIRDAIKPMNGKLLCETQPRIGSTFTIVFDRVA